MSGERQHFDDNETETQQARAFLREKFLRFIAKLSCK